MVALLVVLTAVNTVNGIASAVAASRATVFWFTFPA